MPSTQLRLLGCDVSDGTAVRRLVNGRLFLQSKFCIPITFPPLPGRPTCSSDKFSAAREFFERARIGRQECGQETAANKRCPGSQLTWKRWKVCDERGGAAAGPSLNGYLVGCDVEEEEAEVEEEAEHSGLIQGLTAK